MKIFLKLSIVLFAFSPLKVALARDLSSLLTESEFQQYSFDIAHKVDLFQDIWAQDPDRVFFGGALRDYLFWLKNFILDNAQDHDQAIALLEKLLALDFIPARLFMNPESDLDLLNPNKPISQSLSRWGIAKLQEGQEARFIEGTPHYKTEIDQGFLPIEKLRLSFSSWIVDYNFGEPFESIYFGDYGSYLKHFPLLQNFGSTYFAARRLNHPILLTARMIRVLSLEEDGLEILRNDPKLRSELTNWVQDFMQGLDGTSPGSYLKNNKFKEFLAGTILKSWNQVHDPSDLIEMWKLIGLYDLLKKFPLDVDLNRILFGLPRERSDVPIDPEIAKRVLTPIEQMSGDKTFIYQAKTEDEYHKVLTPGWWLRPTDSKDRGLAVPLAIPEVIMANRDPRQSKRLLLRVTLKGDVRAVDITKGKGADHYSKARVKESKYAANMGLDLMLTPSGRGQNFQLALYNKESIERIEPFDHDEMSANRAVVRDFLEKLDLNVATRCGWRMSRLLNLVKK